MIRKSLLVLLLVALPASSALAATVTSIGPRVGVSSGPDQLVLGGQLSFSEFAPHWSIDPSIELGFGDHQTVVQFNGDVLYHFRIRNSDWAPYAGPGLGIATFNFDNTPPLPHDTETDVGLNLVGGVSIPMTTGNTWFMELRLGVNDLPDLKFIGGVNFRL